ncbi:hypothetical protein, variant 2 [Aphanomyces astaci]|uniref:ABC transmembrane type-1 domain-containing protein n=1 Tax=Aphanomyces astaci TaxID=112090 RepID=W4H4C1_APHAT|nr:hypothetical protein, variant 2 [Aphanomyces astaci]ETV86089.1 hypothetical protein, variant 2 [Aphanomyces astaci]|eukprot:XP_009824560.1 hypothetical protein, variant 2 [Aphanomyces astaci]
MVKGAQTKSGMAPPMPPSLSTPGLYSLLKLADSGGWHYVVMVVLFADFFTNAVAVAFLSVTTYVKYASLCRLVSLGCSGVYALDMLVRLVGIRTALFRSPATLMDFVGCGCMGGMLALRYIKADNLAAVIITRVGYYDEKAGAGNQKFPKFGSNQVEIYFASGYCVLVSARIAFKPVARAFSKTLYEQPSFDLLRFSMASLRATLRRIPSITEAAVDLMEHDLSVTCGRTDGDLSRAELMQFLEKAVVHRPRHMSASAFLSHLRDIDAQSSRFVYGALDVVTSTLRHWSNQRLALFCTVLVVLANASFVPVVAYFISLLGDEAFPQQAGHVAINDAVKGLYLRSQVRYKNVTTDPYTGSDTALPYITPEWSLHAGVVGIVVVCVPFAIVDFLMGYFQSTMIAKATERLQASLLKTILAQPTLFFSQRTEGDLNNLFQSDVARVNALWQAVFWNLMHPLIAIVAGFAFLIYFEPSVGMVSLGFSIMVVTSGPQGHASLKSKDFGSKNAYTSADFQNAIACQQVVRAYGIQSPVLTKFHATTTTLRKAQFLKDFWAGVVQIYVDSAMFFFVAVMTAGLALKVFRADITAGAFFSAVTLMSRISTPVTVLGGFMRVAIGNASSLQRLDEIVLCDKMPERRDATPTLPSLPRMQRALQVDRLSFQYDTTTSHFDLQQVSATFPLGHYVCIVGPSGCGKSTLLGCLMQFYEPSDGVIAVDDHNLHAYSKSSYMGQIAVVFQDGGILNGSILDNIRYIYRLD